MFDVVVSDIAMPDMDGHALLRKLRENPRYAEVPAIACTGFNSERDRAGEAPGFAAHLAKPVEVPRLSSRSRGRSPAAIALRLTRPVHANRDLYPLDPMRTTLDISDDVLQAAKERASRENRRAWARLSRNWRAVR